MLYDTVQIPRKFWLVFNVPGFYNIVEYDVDRVSYAGGKLDRLWGHHGNNKETVYRADFLRTVFFTEQGAKDGLEALIQHNISDNAANQTHYDRLFLPLPMFPQSILFDLQRIEKRL